MVANVVQQKEVTLDGCDVFINFLSAVRAAKEGDEKLIVLFTTLKASIAMEPLAIYGWILSQAPLSIERQLALKQIIEYRGE